MNLYHYCSNHAFHSIVRQREIWLSSLSLSNDTAEGKWLRKIFEDLCGDKKLAKGDTQKVIQMITNVERLIEGLGFCLSEHGDMLSQWRGYSENAAGMSIGFSKDYLEEHSKVLMSEDKQGFSLAKVEYETEKQKRVVEPIYERIKPEIERGAFSSMSIRHVLDSRTDEKFEADSVQQKEAYSNILLNVFMLFGDMFKLKNPAFSEENEWRLISYFIMSENDGVRFRPTVNSIVPYLKIGIPEKEICPIAEVVLGPKNLTPVKLVELFLKQNGFNDVRVTQSEATYR